MVGMKAAELAGRVVAEGSGSVIGVQWAGVGNSRRG